ncbi:FkbM family methyltransferase [Geminocystis herdmanii]|uniref:FkbM family methyltransferase n=1 Tax=Geminocystis herdmanii TaxID=669359 RepID=UPI00034C99B8|nr:FkbM family methyltransferase [Geminocystis herdmanii]
MIHENIKRQIKKILYGKIPPFAGSFPYYGTKVFFPKDSLIFQMACEQGIYEYENIKVVSSLIDSNSFYFDIGTNIGLMSIPILSEHSSCQVVSFEPSPNALPFLERTIKESKYKERWHLVDKATSNIVGNSDFYIAKPSFGALDSFSDTKRTDFIDKVSIPTTTIDTVWENLGCPKVSLIKIDVEGGEYQTIQGGLRCIAQENPYFLIEWNKFNIKPYGYSFDALIDLANQIGYSIFSVPGLMAINNSAILKLKMIETESFLLISNKRIRQSKTLNLSSS